jgi:hypothetical protein
LSWTTEIRRGDKVVIGSGISGIVVFSINTDEYSPGFAKDDWQYLDRGGMVQTESAGLIHLLVADEDTKIVKGGSVGECLHLAALGGLD